MPSANLLLLAAVFDAQLVRWVVWVGLVILTVTLLLLIRTRWGQSQPLGKCVVLSLVAHLLLAIYISTVNIVTHTIGAPEGKGVQVALVDHSGDDVAADPSSDASPASALWDSFAEPALGDTLDKVPDLAPVAPAVEAPGIEEPQRPAPAAPPPVAPPVPAEIPARDEAAPPAITRDTAPAVEPAAKEAQPIEVPPPDAPKEAEPVPPPDTPVPEPAAADKPGDGSGMKPQNMTGGTPANAPKVEVPPLVPIAGRPSGAPGGDGEGAKALPEVYKLRTGDHAQVAKGLGATQESEQAVNAALKWLAANQGPSGRWEPRHTGAGNGKADDGQDRFGAGSSADSGITGLALLAFLAAGNTHLQGPHQVNVRRGLEFLLSIQEADGNLGASQNMYEKMYCHAMATCAISEAYAMSRDQRLQAAVRRAINYTLTAQDRATGGWRYRPADPGDTSQLGWQVMALKSAQLGGLEIPDGTRTGIERFLKSVSLGRSSGLACYQPIRPVPTRSMTAEAIVCRQFLGFNNSTAALAEANKYLLEDVPGAGTNNFYYWYYATLAMYQMQGDGWQRWNTAMQKTLLGSQRTDGELTGSWDPDPVWGGCGGRVYSTALGTLCLEVYYRFLPLYVEAASRERSAK